MDTTDSDDCNIAILARSARDGNLDALALLADTLRGPLFAVAYTELDHYDDAQDAVANALLRICRHLSALRSPEKVRAWAQNIARNEARRLYRNRRLQSPNQQPVQDNEPAPSILLLDIERVLRALPVEQAHTVTLYYRDGLSVRDIAERLRRPEGTIKYWLHRGRAHLQVTLEGYTPMKTPPIPIATIISSELPSALLASMTDALKAAGWSAVRHSSVPSPLARDEQGRIQLSETFTGCQCVVLDEMVMGRSAFEWLLLFRTTEAGREIPVLFLMGSDRPEAQIKDTVLAAYLAGFDMCLTRPFDIAEFQHFASRLR
jgi:RNA polymerase sigma factor (sigma-70 family)